MYFADFEVMRLKTDAAAGLDLIDRYEVLPETITAVSFGKLRNDE